ncbi:unnamed protein product [Microthlaspi erraticum]|uniref:Uncharacterized protein n=1 Tax=Microthlaspi erraticum TaxID=1685480 RepID=A0A6D2JMC2_9BRAS|nr:unnamed protein product [Microthlaspi erraticum]
MAIFAIEKAIRQFLTTLVTVVDVFAGEVGILEDLLHYSAVIPTLGSSTQRDAVSSTDFGEKRLYKWRTGDPSSPSISSNLFSNLLFPFRFYDSRCKMADNIRRQIQDLDLGAMDEPILLPVDVTSNPAFNHCGSATNLDEDIDPNIDPDQTDAEEPVTIPVLRRSPRTRAGLISVREEFNQSIEGLITLMEHEELKETLLTTEISQETPRLNQEAKETDQDDPHTTRRAQEQLKISSTPFLPVLQGTKETTVFIITKQVEALP